MQNRKGKALVWLRNDLRVNDQTSLFKATQVHEHVIALYCFDLDHYKKTKWGFKKTGAFRTQFLIESINQLQSDLNKINISLIITVGNTVDLISQWVNKLEVTDIYFQNEWTKEEHENEKALRKRLSPSINFHSHYDQFLFHPDELPTDISNLPEVFTVFRKQCEKESSVRPCFPSPTSMPMSNLHGESFSCPTLSELGLEETKQHVNSAFPFKGGSLAGKERIDHYFWKSKKLSFYKQTRNGLVGLDYSSKFSAWLSNGSLSSRQLYWEVKSYEKEIQKNQSTYWMIFELIWRDYFKYISLKHQNKIFLIGGILQRNYKWKKDSNNIHKWITGTTREPFVNANMLELAQTGWMSNRGRQNVASYFSKELLLDWRIGAAYFESQLIDYDVHSNYGNWMYVSGVGNDPRDRKFNIQFQAERYDNDGKFQRIWNQKTLFE